MKIVLDAGHGGTDPGSVGPGGNLEKIIALKVVRKLQSILVKGHCVILSRYDDSYVSLKERCDLANVHSADIFVSIHCNSAGVATATGIETFHHPKSKNGIRLAKEIQAQLVKATGLADRKAKVHKDKLYVLYHTQMPAVLVEIGFINNHIEEQLIASEEYQEKCAEAIARGIESYFA